VKLKAVVLFVGTNNTDCTPHEIFEGILEIIKEIKHKLGNIVIILPVSLSRNCTECQRDFADAAAQRTVFQPL
jgi:hypothetical protein